MIPLVVVALLALAMLALQHFTHRAQVKQTNILLGTFAAERTALARERWDLATRITAPELVRAQPPAPPSETPPLEVLAALGVVPPALIPDAPADPDDFDESFLVGTGPGEA
jgi:hypothetical protein